jgi:hypothetical protein
MVVSLVSPAMAHLGDKKVNFPLATMPMNI